MVAFNAPFVVSLAGATLPFAADACVALSVPVALSRVAFPLRPQAAAIIVAAAIAAVESRIRMLSLVR
jgi:hypothetical protein